MTTSQDKPAQRHFVHKLIDWKRVQCRLERYPAIERAFPLNTLKWHCESPPYYCHYMSWRLGTWQNESLFQCLEELLGCAEALPHWEHEQPLLRSAEFGDFWSLVWQLQVAEHLYKVGTDVRWAESGPDLSVKIGGERWFVECYAYRKSFVTLSFLEELLLKLDPAVRTNYDLCSPFRLPQNSDRAAFLHQVLSPFLDPAFVENAMEKAKRKYPEVLYKHPSSSLYVYVEGDDVDAAYEPGIISSVVGNPESYLQVALREAVGAKQCSNELKNHHPNLVAVNYLLSTDYQVAKSLPERVQSLTLPEIEPNIDVLAASAIGIDERLSREKLEVIEVSRSHVNCKHLNEIADPSGSGPQPGQRRHSKETASCARSTSMKTSTWPP